MDAIQEPNGVGVPPSTTWAINAVLHSLVGSVVLVSLGRFRVAENRLKAGHQTTFIQCSSVCAVKMQPCVSHRAEKRKKKRKKKSIKKLIKHKKAENPEKKKTRIPKQQSVDQATRMRT
ncbi:hypothetical protein BO78DRAFT_168998 [Aspergillus sclerotiicarbonarius CBS 121057]|uniref:Uncharacterized protein n=1 Tax=Aspergillus sclerotiicarbonarius (strain CBS 121057 / IBT 28362) TaxID=1448318 RepID=A0A319ETK1_ASPSB|nr:hypothetical protein BO78DRAFT_168998 [Aspergillus sclerotiicarbonarius CBS 121057]